MRSVLLLLMPVGAYYANRFIRREFGTRGVLLLALGGPVVGLIIGRLYLGSGFIYPADVIILALIAGMIAVPVWPGQACDLVRAGFVWIFAKWRARRQA